MDLLDRLVAVLRALFGDSPPTGGRRSAGSGPGSRPAGGYSSRPVDPDLAAAWDELNDYLGAERRGSGDGASRSGQERGRRERGSGAGYHGSPGGTALPPESLRSDYANLEVPFGADAETVRRSYKRLVLRYHPDRHAGDPEKLRVATEITKKINESFERIRGFQERDGPPSG